MLERINTGLQHIWIGRSVIILVEKRTGAKQREDFRQIVSPTIARSASLSSKRRDPPLRS